MNVDNIPILMAFFWQGFSLSFITLTWFRRLRWQFETRSVAESKTSLAPVSISMRCALSILGLIGAFGAAGLVGTFRNQFPGADLAVLAGLVVGIWIVWVMNKGVELKGQGTGA